MVIRNNIKKNVQNIKEENLEKEGRNDEKKFKKGKKQKIGG